MYTTSGIISILATIIGSYFFCLILCLSLKEFLKVKISNIKVMLLGISLMVFSVAIIKDGIPYGLDQVISAVGFGFCIFGFTNKIDIKKKK